MKVFISADIEGTADLASFAEAGNENPQLYTRGMIQMSREVGAVCRGALSAGAEFVAVKESHGYGLNIMHEYLPEPVTLIRGEVRNPYSMVGGIDESYDAVLFVGYHDGAGQGGNPMAHTISSRRIREITINGASASELMLFSYACTYLGIPTAFVSGDEAICEKAKMLNPLIAACPVKRGIGAAVAGLHPEKAEKMLEDSARKALEGNPDRYTYVLPPEFHVTVSYHKHYDAEGSSYYPGAYRLDPHPIGFQSADYYEVLRFFHFVL